MPEEEAGKVPLSKTSSQTDRRTIEQEIKQRKSVEAMKDSIARRVYALVYQQSNFLPEPAQLQNLRTLAANTESVEELRIFLLYQMHRTGRAPIRPEFGRPLLLQIDELSDPHPTAKYQKPELSMAYIRLFLGYLYRYGRFARDNQGAGIISRLGQSTEEGG